MMVLNQIEAKKAQNNRNVNLEKDEATDNKNKLNIVEYRYKYNKDGTLKSSYFNNMEYQYKYNLEGMLESKSASGKTLLKYTYDKNNNIKTIKDISGKSSVYYYDENNRIKSIKDNNNISLAEYSYYNNDAIKSLKLGNGVKSDYTYDGDGNVKSLVTIGANGELLLDYKYAYDLNGNRTEKIGNKHKNYYSYDNMNRLKEARYDNISEKFTYDKAQNRLTKTTDNIIERYTYNVKNQLKEIQGKDEKTVFTYDKQGNTIKEETNNGSNIFEYNTLNKAIKAVTKEGNTLVSRYDSEGLRYEIEENEKLSRFIFHKDNVLVETDKNYNVISRFARGYEVVSADIKQDSPTNCNLKCTPKDDDLERYFYIVDEQGSTTLIINSSANVANEYYYDAFGNVLESTEDIHNRITYTGQQFDGTTQQYYLRARFYNPSIGRFTQEDIYRGDGLNLYAYCKNNPVMYYDPSGYVCDSKKTSLNTEGASNPDWITNKGYKPQPGERTFEGYVKNNADPEISLYTDSAGFNNNKGNLGGEFKRYGANSHGGVSPHVHQPQRNVAPNGNTYGSVGTKTGNGGVTTPNSKDIKQLYEYLENGKYHN